jgi:hypothetical protein
MMLRRSKNMGGNRGARVREERQMWQFDFWTTHRMCTYQQKSVKIEVTP